MSFETQQFVSQPYVVNAVQVTEDNLEELAAWCKGDVRTTGAGKTFRFTEGTKYIKLPGRVSALRHSMAFAGDWLVVRDDGLFKLYTANNFPRHFVPKQEKTLENQSLSTSEVAFDGDPESVVVLDEPLKG